MPNTMKQILAILIAIVPFLFSYKKTEQQKEITTADSVKTESTLTPAPTKATRENTVSEIYNKQQIPVLCYHRIAEGGKSEYSVTPETFKAHMQTLADSGYRSIQPDQLYDYLVYNKELPSKSFLVTFDDSREEHSTIAAPVLEKLGFRGVFFIMTITYDKKNYMTKDQIAGLAKAGHCIGLHSWDHTMATKYKDSTDWKKQVVEPQKKLAGITGKPVEYWAYPNGVFNHESAKELSKHFKIAFELSTKRDSLQPLQCVRRIIVPDISAQSLLKSMRNSFAPKKKA